MNILYYRLLLITLCLLPSAPVFSGDREIAAFDVSYDLFRDNNQVGEMTLKAEKSEAQLRWQAITRPTGFYALLTQKRPYSESIQKRTEVDFRLASVRIATNRNKQPYEIAIFDWEQFQLTSMRKGQKNRFALPEKANIYDYLSIHWLSAYMSLVNIDEYKLTFYRKGKLVQSVLTSMGTESLNIGRKMVQTKVFRQHFKASSQQLVYHYSFENPWLPLQIKSSEKGKKTVLMRLKSL